MKKRTIAAIYLFHKNSFYWSSIAGFSQHHLLQEFFQSVSHPYFDRVSIGHRNDEYNILQVSTAHILIKQLVIEISMHES